MNLGTSRREWIATAAGAAAGCGRGRKPAHYGYRGFAFVANSAGKAVAAVDLNAFAVVRRIALESNPVQMVNDPIRPLVYAVMPAAGELAAISAAKLELVGRVRVGVPPGYAKASSDGRFLWALSPKGRQLARIPAGEFRAPDLRIP